jgi:hypothetical protein
MHFLIGLGILAGLAWFAFGASAARAIVGVVLTLPVLAILIFITGEATRGGPDDVPFGKLGHRVHVEQQQQPQASVEQKERDIRDSQAAAEQAERDKDVAEYRAKRAARYFAETPAQRRQITLEVEAELARHRVNSRDYDEVRACATELGGGRDAEAECMR